MPTRANRDTNSYGMKVGNGAQAPHTEIEDRICLNIYCRDLNYYLVASRTGHSSNSALGVSFSEN